MKKINLATAITHGAEVMTMNPVSPSAWAVYYKICIALNPSRWETLILHTTLKGLGNGLNLRPYRVRDALKELVKVNLICTKPALDSHSTCTQLALDSHSTCTRNAPDLHLSCTQLAIELLPTCTCSTLNGSLKSCSDANSTPQINKSINKSNKCEKKSNAEKILQKLENVELFDDGIEYDEPEIPIKEQMNIDCIKYDINKLINKGLPFSITSENLLRNYRLNTRRFIQLYM